MTTDPIPALGEASELPEPCAVGAKLLELGRGEALPDGALTRILAEDEELCEHVLCLANASLPASLPRIASLEEAAARLGEGALRHAALGFSVVAANRVGSYPGFDFGRFWSNSLARAVACHALSRQAQVGNPMEAFALGLLCEMGRFALAGARNSGGAGELADDERQLFSIDHVEVTRGLLHRWGLPPAFVAAVGVVRDADLGVSAGPLRSLEELLGVAEALASLVTGEAGGRSADSRQLAERIGLSPAGFRELFSRVVREWGEWTRAIDLPSRPAPGPGPVALVADGDALQNPARRLRMLVVDDDPVSLRLLQRHLVHAGHDVLVACDGDEALYMATESRPQLVVADWQMPGLDGIELCRQLRRNDDGRKIYFLLLTGHGEVENVVNAFDAGVDDYVEKPFNPKVLLARIKAGRRIIDLQEQVERDKLTQKKQVAELQLLTRKLRLAAFTDALTGLPNRRYAMKRLGQAWSSSVRAETPLSLVMIDIDEFKCVNDEFGHDVGDVVLKETGSLLRTILREKEDVCRLGGEEFLVICEDSSLDDAVRLAERLRAAVEANVIACGPYESAVTMSLGVAQREEVMHSGEHLLKAADEAVYRAKFGGRNQVCVSLPPRPPAKSA